MPSIPTTPPVALSFPEEFRVPLVVAVPHAGQDYHPAFLDASRQPLELLQRAEDRFVDRLFESAPLHGAAMLRALFPRVWCDVNRDRSELDAHMFKPPLDRASVTRSAKVRAGFGVIPRLVSTGRAIYSRCLDPRAAERRIAYAWLPYHQTLEAALQRMYARFGYVILLDAHSMPPLAQARRCDVVLGDRHGQSCAPALMSFLEAAFQNAGYVTQRNIPYAGGYVTQHYGKPENGVHVVQIELCRTLYMNTATLLPSRNFNGLQSDIVTILGETARALVSGGALPAHLFVPPASLAAE